MEGWISQRYGMLKARVVWWSARVDSQLMAVLGRGLYANRCGTPGSTTDMHDLYNTHATRTKVFGHITRSFLQTRRPLEPGGRDANHQTTRSG